MFHLTRSLATLKQKIAMATRPVYSSPYLYSNILLNNLFVQILKSNVNNKFSLSLNLFYGSSIFVYVYLFFIP